jgi:hypothetical protein
MPRRHLAAEDDDYYIDSAGVVSLMINVFSLNEQLEYLRLEIRDHSGPDWSG